MSLAIAIIATALFVWVCLAALIDAYDPWSTFTEALGLSAVLIVVCAAFIGAIIGLLYLWEWAL